MLYQPLNNEIKDLPENTFSSVLAGQPVNSNGQFKFLSIAGRWLYQIEYKNGKEYSYGVIKPASFVKTSSRHTARTTTECTDWYLVTTYNYADGSSETVEQYVGTTCSGCDDPNEASLCPDGGGGGDDNSCISEATTEFNDESSSSEVASDMLGSTVSSIDDFTKYKNPNWKCLSGYSGWSLISHEVGEVKLIDPSNNQWAWQSLSHNSITMEGSTLPGVSVSFTQGIGTPSFTPDNAARNPVLYAGMSLNFTVTYTFVCNCPGFPLVGWVPPVNKSYTSTITAWDANPNH